MAADRISIADLVSLEDGDKIDVAELAEGKGSVYAMVREDVHRAAEQSRKRPKTRNSDFYELVPSTSLEKCMDRILHGDREKEPRVAAFERSFKYDFDKKMRRIKRIKSKAYRRIRRMNKAKSEQLDEQGQDQAAGGCEEQARVPDILLKEMEASEDEEVPILSFGGAEDEPEGQEALVRLAFADGAGENEREFVREKQEVVNKEAPRIDEVVLPGWGVWGGPGLEVVRTRANTIRNVVEGVRHSNRKDFNKSHVIVNEGAPGTDKKFMAELPFGYTEEEYNEKIAMPISRERNTLRIFRKLVKPRVGHVNGEVIEPLQYVPE